MVCVSRVEGRTGAPARGAPDVATAHKVCACESQPRTLQRRLAPPPAAVDGGVDGLRRPRGGRASLAPVALSGGADGVTEGVETK